MTNFAPILWRECKVNLTNKSRVANNFLNPVIALVLFAAMFSVYIARVPYGNTSLRFVDFFIPGLLTMQVFALFSTTFSLVRLDNVSGFLTNIAISKTGLHSYYVGSLLANMLVTILRIIILVAVARLAVGSPLPPSLWNVAIVLLAVCIGSVLWYSLGFVCGLLIKREDIRDILFSLVTLPMTFASSVYYNVDRVSPSLRKIALLNPLTYNCDVIREAFFFDKPLPWSRDIALLATLAAFLLVAALLSLSKALR
ncbi:MAG: ABC transporter permease [Bacteroidota bacterium]